MKTDPQLPCQSLGIRDDGALVVVDVLKQRRLLASETLALCLGFRKVNLGKVNLGKVNKALEINFWDTEGMGQLDELGQLGHGFPQTCKPERQLRLGEVQLPLPFGKSADIGNDAIEHVPATHHFECRGLSSIEGDTQLVQACSDELIAFAGGQ